MRITLKRVDIGGKGGSQPQRVRAIRAADLKDGADSLAIYLPKKARIQVVAAFGLMKMQEQHGTRPGDLPREYLSAFVASGDELRDWAAIVRIGEAARPALELALRDDDPVVRREALQVKRVLDFKANLRRRRPSLRTRLMRNRILRGLFGRG